MAAQAQVLTRYIWELSTAGDSGHGDRPTVGAAGRRGIDSRMTTYRPLMAEVVTAHLAGEIDLGLCPMLRGGDRGVPGSYAVAFDVPACRLDLAWCLLSWCTSAGTGISHHYALGAGL